MVLAYEISAIVQETATLNRDGEQAPLIKTFRVGTSNARHQIRFCCNSLVYRCIQLEPELVKLARFVADF